MDAGLRKKLTEVAAAFKAAGAGEVYLFGSAVRGTRHGGSDVDLAVAGLPPEKFLTLLARATEMLGCPVDLVDLDEDSPFTRYLKQEGELQRVA